MRLDFNAFRLIKPAGTDDNYLAGASVNSMNLGAKSKVTEKRKKLILDLLTKKGLMTNSQISEALQIEKSVTINLTRKMVENNEIKKGEPIQEISAFRKAFTFYVAN